MNSQLQEIVFNELKNRYDRFIIYVIREYFKGEDVRDMYQEVSIHLYNKIGDLYDDHPDLFSTRSWIRSVVGNFCVSELRRRKGKKKIQLVFDDTSVNNSGEFEEFHSDIDKNEDLNAAISDFLKNLSKRDALMLKMKYYYGKSTTYISRKMNETHVSVYIGRLKERLIKRTGISNLESFVKKYNTYL
jgi:RNA polymerase sigma factor (sigma-70 family)